MELLALLINVVLPLGPSQGVFSPPLLLSLVTCHCHLPANPQLPPPINKCTGTPVPHHQSPALAYPATPSSQAPPAFMGHILGLLISCYFRSMEEVAGRLDTAHPLRCPHLFLLKSLYSQAPHWLLRIATVIPTALAGTQSPGVLGVISHIDTHDLPAPPPPGSIS